MYKTILHSLRGTNLEVAKFGMYIMFPIGWMYYFGTNLEDRFNVKSFWPTQEQSHKIPYEKAEIKEELDRMRRLREERDRATRMALAGAASGERRVLDGDA